MPNTVLTNFGLDYVLSADDYGPRIYLKYFVPVYDYRMDPLIHNDDLPASATSQIASDTISRTSPFGEVIWNTDGADYSLTNQNENWIISGSGSSWNDGSKVMTDAVQSQRFQINTYDGTPLWTHAYAPASAAFSPPDRWDLDSNAFISAGDNTPSLASTDKYFQVVDYFPVVSGDGAGIRGNFKCMLRKDIGEVKFNKLALYAVRVNPDGSETGEDPVFFAETYEPTTMVRTPFGNGGFDDVITDVQIDLASISSDISDIFYSTSGDYWHRVPEGLYYPESIGIGSFENSVNAPSATVHARHSRTFPNKPNWRADYSDSLFITEDVTSAGNVEQNHVHGSTAWKLITDISTYERYPETDGLVKFGKDGNRYHSAKFADSVSVSAVDGNKAFITLSASSAQESDYTKTQIHMSNFGKIVFDEANGTDQVAYVKGADYWRDEEDLCIVTKARNSAYSSDVLDIFMLAGFNSSAAIDSSVESDTGYSGFVHPNWTWRMKGYTNYAYQYLNPNARVWIAGAKDIRTWGPIQLNHTYEQNERTAIYSKNQYIQICPYLKSTKNAQNLLAVTSDADYATVAGTSADPIGFQRAAGKLDIVGTLRVLHTIEPIIGTIPQDSTYFGWIGRGGSVQGPTAATTRNRWKRLFVEQIGAYSGQAAVEIAGPSNPTPATFEDERVEYLFVKNIGNSGNGQCDYIYSNEISVSTLRVTTNPIAASGGIEFGSTLIEQNATFNTYKEYQVSTDLEYGGAGALTASITVNLIRIGKVVTVKLSDTKFTGQTLSTSSNMYVKAPTGGWPSWAIPVGSAAAIYARIPIIVYKNGKTVLGSINISGDDLSWQILAWNPSDGTYGNMGTFPANKSNNGVASNVFSFIYGT